MLQGKTTISVVRSLNQALVKLVYNYRAGSGLREPAEELCDVECCWLRLCPHWVGVLCRC